MQESNAVIPPGLLIRDELEARGIEPAKTGGCHAEAGKYRTRDYTWQEGHNPKNCTGVGARIGNPRPHLGAPGSGLPPGFGAEQSTNLAAVNKISVWYLSGMSTSERRPWQDATWILRLSNTSTGTRLCTRGVIGIQRPAIWLQVTSSTVFTGWCTQYEMTGRA